MIFKDFCGSLDNHGSSHLAPDNGFRTNLMIFFDFGIKFEPSWNSNRIKNRYQLRDAYFSKKKKRIF